jgi:hypothetical protein
MITNNVSLTNQIFNSLVKIEKDITIDSSRIKNLESSFNQKDIKDIPSFDDINQFLQQVNTIDSIAYKIDSILSCPENIKHQTGRGEMSLIFMMKNAHKSKTQSGEFGDITVNDKSYELKKESGIIDFAVKTRGKVTEMYNSIIETRCMIKKFLNKYFQDLDVTKDFNQSFDKKISEFSNKDFLKFESILDQIKQDNIINNSSEGKMLVDLIDNLVVSQWRKDVAREIIQSYSGGVIVYRKKKKRSNVLNKYELLDPNKVIVYNLTLGNIQLKII